MIPDTNLDDLRKALKLLAYRDFRVRLNSVLQLASVSPDLTPPDWFPDGVIHDSAEVWVSLDGPLLGLTQLPPNLLLFCLARCDFRDYLLSDIAYPKYEVSPKETRTNVRGQFHE